MICLCDLKFHVQVGVVDYLALLHKAPRIVLTQEPLTTAAFHSWMAVKQHPLNLIKWDVLGQLEILLCFLCWLSSERWKPEGRNCRPAPF